MKLLAVFYLALLLLLFVGPFMEAIAGEKLLSQNYFRVDFVNL